MKEIKYGNHVMQKGFYTPLAVRDKVFEEIVDSCNGHYGFGGEDKTTYYVDVNDWGKAIDIINEDIEWGNVYVLKKSKIKKK